MDEEVSDTTYDVAIIGYGPTGLTAALALGHVSASDYERWVVPADMAHPHR